VITYMNAFHQTGLTQEPDPKTTGVAMRLLAVAEALLFQRKTYKVLKIIELITP
jgi:hypothetical protein